MPTPKHAGTVTGWTQTFAPDGSEQIGYRSLLAELDAHGQRVRERAFAPDGGLESVRTFEEAGRLREELAFNRDGSVDHKRVHRYDEGGVELEDALYLGGERFHGKWVSSLDRNGRVGERRWHNSDGVAEVTETCEYDAAGRLIARIRGNVAEWRYRYDMQGRLAGIAGGHHSADEPDDAELEYGENGRLLKETRYFVTGAVRSVTRYDYELHEHAAP